ncbi:MAG: methionyl-tRNA formyltransferase [Coprobacillus sp.]
MDNKRIVFMGTATFSLEVLKMLIEEKYNVVGVVSQPDRYVGRKKVLTMPDVKVEALKHDIQVIQPQRIKEDYQAVLDLKPDLIITAAYGQIIPKIILDAPSLGCVNVHASLLPMYRGGAPVHQAIIDGQEKTGVTIMYMVAKMDAGNIISQVETKIEETDTLGILYDRLSVIGAKLLKETLPSIIEGTNQSIVQDESLITYAPTLSRDDERIDWSLTARDIFNKVRGMDPWPGSYTTYEGKTVKIWGGRAHNCENAVKHHAHQDNGTVVKIFKDAIGVKVNDGVFLITEFQLEGKKRMSVKDYLNGHNIFEVDTKFI